VRQKFIAAFLERALASAVIAEDEIVSATQDFPGFLDAIARMPDQREFRSFGNLSQACLYLKGMILADRVFGDRGAIVCIEEVETGSRLASIFVADDNGVMCSQQFERESHVISEDREQYPLLQRT
jgi:hypothetical protein